MENKSSIGEKENLKSGFCVSAALLFMLFVYAPTELYCYNKDEFWFDYKVILPIMAVLLLGGMLLSALAILLIHAVLPKLYDFVVLPVLSIAFLCTYIQGNFLVENLPRMDGSVPDGAIYLWRDYLPQIYQSVLLWIVVTVVVVIAYKMLKKQKFCKAVRIISLCMLLMFVVTMGSVLLTTRGYQSKPEPCATVKDLYAFSEEDNYIILVLDSLDAATLSELMEEKPEYKEIFQDFTYYENMMGAYSCTGVAIPHILSGNWFENETTIKQYAIESYKNSPLINSMEEAGYRLGMYEYEMPYEDDSVYRFSNVSERNDRVRSYVELAKLEVKLVGIRYAPFPLKLACVFNTVRFAALWDRDGVGAEQKDGKTVYPVFMSDNGTFYNRMNESEIEIVEDKCFKFIHIDGAHVPFSYDENLNPIANATYRDSIKASLTITKAFLDKLKAAGVYDNSSIIIMADHGFAEEYGYDASVGACDWRQNPIFFAKGRGESHDMEVSKAPVSYVDLQEAFVRLQQGAVGSDIFTYKEGEKRERRFIYYDFVFDEYMYEYKSTGHAADDAAMTLTGEEYVR